MQNLLDRYFNLIPEWALEHLPDWLLAFIVCCAIPVGVMVAVIKLIEWIIK